MESRWQHLILCTLLVFVTSCEDVEEVPVHDYYQKSRTSDQIRQDSLHKTLLEAEDLSSRQQENINRAMGSLGIAQGDSPETGIPALILALSRSGDQDTVLQKEIILSLGETQSDLAVATLSQGLLKTANLSADGNINPDSDAILTSPIRAAAAAALGLTSSKAAVPPLIEALQDSELDVRQAAQKSLQVLANVDNQYNPLDSFEDRVIGQSQWASWWQNNRDLPRHQWVVNGFQKRGLVLDELFSSESLPVLISALEKGEPYIRMNAVQTLAKFEINDPDELNTINGTLIDLLDHDLASVKQSALVALIRHNGLQSVHISQAGHFDFSKSLDFDPDKNLEATIAFVKDWWQNGDDEGLAE